VAEREEAVDDADEPELPAIDDETAETIIDRVLEGLRDLFQRDEQTDDS
jgi:hypothetical protein